MIFKIATPEDEHIMETYVRSHEKSQIYHTVGWKKVIEATYGYKSLYLLLLDNDDIIGFLPFFWVRGLLGKKRLVSLPYSHMVHPLVSDDTVLEKILLKAEDLAKDLNAEYIQLKCELKEFDHKWQHVSFFHDSVLDLRQDINDIHKKFKSSTRRNIKKAQKEGMTLRIGNCRRDFNNFYELIVETRKRQGAPPYSKSFFLQLYEHFNSGQMRLYLALYQKRPIAGIIMFYHGLNAIYAYGASVSDNMLLRMRPNDLLFWNVIEDAWQKGYHFFDFGITPFSNPGLLRYKSQWGAKTSKVRYAYYLNRLSEVPVLDRTGRFGTLASSIFRTLPDSLLKIAGPIVLKYFG